MQGAGFQDQRPAAHAGFVQTHGKIIVLKTPANVGLVKPVNPLDILAENGKMAPKNFGLMALGQT